MRTNQQNSAVRRSHREAPITVRMDKSMKTRLQEHCRESDLTVSQLIRRAVKRELAAIGVS